MRRPPWRSDPGRRSPAARAFAGVVRNSSWAVAAHVVLAVSVLGQTVVLARYLSPEGFGLFLLLIAYPEAVQQVLDFRAHEAMTRYFTGFITQDRKREAVALVKLLWLVDVVISAVALLIVAATAGVAARLLVKDAELGGLMIIYAFGLFLGSLDAASGSVLRSLDLFALQFRVGAISNLSQLGLVLLVVGLGGGLTALIWARVGAQLIRTLLVGGAALRALRQVVWEERGAPVGVLRDQFAEMRGFLVSTNLTGVVRMAATKLDVILVGALLTPSAVALYKVALQFGRMPLMLSDSLLVAIFPTFSRSLAKGRTDEVRYVAHRSTKLLALLVLPVTPLLALEGDTVMRIVAGDSFGAAGTAFVLCLAGVIPYTLFFWLPPLLLATGHAGPLLKLSAVATLAQLAFLVVLAPEFGPAGAATAVAIMYVVTLVLQLDFVRRKGLLVSAAPSGSSPEAAPPLGSRSVREAE